MQDDIYQVPVSGWKFHEEPAGQLRSKLQVLGNGQQKLVEVAGFEPASQERLWIASTGVAFLLFSPREREKARFPLASILFVYGLVPDARTWLYLLTSFLLPSRHQQRNGLLLIKQPRHILHCHI